MLLNHVFIKEKNVLVFPEYLTTASYATYSISDFSLLMSKIISCITLMRKLKYSE